MGATAAIAAEVVATVAVAKATQPKPPKLEPPIPMPDPLETERAKKQSIVEQMARRGRSGSILTSDSGGKLGG